MSYNYIQYMKVSRSKLFPIIFLIIIVLVIILYFLNNLYIGNTPITIPFIGPKVIENLDEVKKWTFEDKDPGDLNWYTVKKNGWYSSRITNLSLTPDNKKLSISFYLKMKNTWGEWRNIFHFTTGGDCCGIGQRIPAVWVIPNSYELHIRFSTNANGNDGINTNANLGPNKSYLITLVFDGDNFTYYIDNAKTKNTYSGIKSRSRDTQLYIGDPYYNSNGGVLISGFTVYDSDILDCEVNNRVINKPL